MSSERRRQPRHAMSASLRFKCTDWNHFLEVYAKNISYGGIFVEMRDPPPVDSPVEVQIQVPGGRHVTIKGRVAHIVVPANAGKGWGEPGIGVQFTEIGPEDERRLYALVREAKEWRDE